MILGIGFGDPFLVGLIALAILLVLVFLGVRVVFAAAAVGLLGLVELIGWGPAAGHRRHHPALQILDLRAERAADVHPHRLHRVPRRA